MEFLKSLAPWLVENYAQLFVVVGAAIAFAETIVVLTPTKTDDGAVKRLGEFFDKVREILKIPSMKAKEVKEDPK